MHESKFVIQEPDADGVIVCSFQRDDLDAAYLTSHVIEHVELYNTGDLKWMAMLLGMTDMSNEWCIFCLMRKLQWNKQGHTKGQLRTIEKILEIYGDPAKKEAAERLG